MHRARLAVISLATLVLAACGAPADADLDESDSALASGEIALLVGVAQGRSVDQDFANRSDFTRLSSLYGRVQVGAKGPAGSRVFVRYRAQEKGGKELRAWGNVDAKWVAGDVWEFETPEISRRCDRQCADIEFSYALAFESGGATTWNNNGKANFRAADGATQIATFGKQKVIQSGDYYSSAASKVLVWAMHGEPRAKVTVHYSTDGWRTSRDVVAGGAVRERSGNVVTDLTYLPVPAGKTVDYAVRYEVDGKVSWDNNIGRNYRIVATPGS